MVKTMCERVNLHPRAGSYILSMCRLQNKFPGGLIDMVEVAQLIKYVSENQADLKPQFQEHPTNWYPNKQAEESATKANFTFLK